MLWTFYVHFTYSYLAMVLNASVPVGQLFRFKVKLIFKKRIVISHID